VRAPSPVPVDLARRFLRWTFFRAALARGWWLVTAVYLVLVAELTPFQLVFVGTAQGITVVLAEVPAGVLADAVSRRLALVVAHLTSGTGMLLTGLVTDYPLILLSQCLWGLGWAFSSGADIAWITDELDDSSRIDRVLTARARWDLAGAAAGTLAFGAMAWATSLATAVVAAGAGMIVLGFAVVARFPETRFVPVVANRWRHASGIFRAGVRLARGDRVILVIIVATLLVNGGHEGYGRLLENRLLGLGFPREPDPIVWFTVLSLTGLAAGIAVLWVVEARILGAGMARRAYAAACVGVALGMLVLAHAPSAAWAVAGVFAVNGIAGPVIRPVGDIWLNRRATSDVRATVHSFSSQAENLGEIIFGFGLALLAGAWSPTAALTGSVVLMAVAGVVVSRGGR